MRRLLTRIPKTFHRCPPAIIYTRPVRLFSNPINQQQDSKLNTEALYDQQNSSDDEEFDQIVQLDSLMKDINDLNQIDDEKIV